MAHSSLRFGIGRFTTEAEIDFVVKHIVSTVNKLREMRLVKDFITATMTERYFTARYGKWFKRASTSTRLTGRSTNYMGRYLHSVPYLVIITSCIFYGSILCCRHR